MTLSCDGACGARTARRPSWISGPRCSFGRAGVKSRDPQTLPGWENVNVIPVNCDEDVTRDKQDAFYEKVRAAGLAINSEWERRRCHGARRVSTVRGAGPAWPFRSDERTRRRTGSGSSVTASPKPAAESYAVGEIKVTTLVDGQRSFALPDDLIGNATRDEVNAAFAEAGMAKDAMTIFFNPVVIETGGRRVLVDTGNGAAAAAQPNATTGLMTASLAAAGIDPKSIDLVIVSCISTPTT